MHINIIFDCFQPPRKSEHHRHKSKYSIDFWPILCSSILLLAISSGVSETWINNKYFIKWQKSPNKVGGNKNWKDTWLMASTFLRDRPNFGYAKRFSSKRIHPAKATNVEAHLKCIGGNGKALLAHLTWLFCEMVILSPYQFGIWDIANAIAVSLILAFIATSIMENWIESFHTLFSSQIDFRNQYNDANIVWERVCF